MIDYKIGWSQIGFIFKLNGSILPQAFAMAMPCSLIAVALKVIDNEGIFDVRPLAGTSNGAWSGFSFLVSFVIVFRTSQSYSRFNEAFTQSHQMISEWVDAAGSLIAFAKTSKSDEQEILEFKHIVVRLFSSMSAAALEQLTEQSVLRYTGFETLDAEGLTSQAIDDMKESGKKGVKVVLIYQWIQNLILESAENGLLNTPPPILSRSLTELATGMVKFHDALKISKVPFPFPYAQVTVVLLLFHWCLTPIVMVQWTEHWWASAVFTFVQVFALWSLNAIDTGLESPFGGQANDIDPYIMQKRTNEHLLFLLGPRVNKTTPKLSSGAITDYVTLRRQFAEDRKQCREDQPESYCVSCRRALCCRLCRRNVVSPRSPAPGKDGDSGGSAKRSSRPPDRGPRKTGESSERPNSRDAATHSGHTMVEIPGTVLDGTACGLDGCPKTPVHGSSSHGLTALVTSSQTRVSRTPPVNQSTSVPHSVAPVKMARTIARDDKSSGDFQSRLSQAGLALTAVRALSADAPGVQTPISDTAHSEVPLGPMPFGPVREHSETLRAAALPHADSNVARLVPVQSVTAVPVARAVVVLEPGVDPTPGTSDGQVTAATASMHTDVSRVITEELAARASLSAGPGRPTLPGSPPSPNSTEELMASGAEALAVAAAVSAVHAVQAVTGDSVVAEKHGSSQPDTGNSESNSHRRQGAAEAPSLEAGAAGEAPSQALPSHTESGELEGVAAAWCYTESEELESVAELEVRSPHASVVGHGVAVSTVQGGALEYPVGLPICATGKISLQALPLASSSAIDFVAACPSGQPGDLYRDASYVMAVARVSTGAPVLPEAPPALPPEEQTSEAPIESPRSEVSDAYGSDSGSEILGGAGFLPF